MGYLDTYWDNPTLWSIEISVLDLDNPVFLIESHWIGTHSPGYA